MSGHDFLGEDEVLTDSIFGKQDFTISEIITSSTIFIIEIIHVMVHSYYTWIQIFHLNFKKFSLSGERKFSVLRTAMDGTIYVEISTAEDEAELQK